MTVPPPTRPSVPSRSCVGLRPGRRGWVLLALVAFPVLTACGGADTPAASSVTVRDSAGITVVENPPPAEDAWLAWQVSEAPLLDLGTLDGPETHQFFRVGDAHRFSDGRIAVSDAGSSQVRFFDPDGRHLATWGGPGDGPGDFRAPGAVLPWPAGDSVAVWDQQLRRMTLFDAGGEPGRTFAFEGLDDIPALDHAGLLESGALVVTGMAFELEDDGGLSRMPFHAAIADPTGAVQGRLGALPGREAVIRANPGRVEIVGVPFARRALTAAVGDAVVFATNDRWTLRIHGADGALQRIVRVNRPTRPVTPEDRAAQIEIRVQAAPEEARPRVRSSMSDAPYPDSMPAFDRILSDPAGHLWVHEYRPGFEEGPELWSVFDGEGRLLGRVETPAGLELFRIGEDYLLGRATDELDVEHVQLWGLQR